MDLLKKVESRLKRFNITSSEIVIVGCSGGPDSMALLDLIRQSNCIPVAAHLNYQKRGEESERDQKLIEKYCRENNLEFKVKRVDPENMSGNFQNTARDIRYKFFDQLRAEMNARFICTAHQNEDQVETILMNILRGKNPASWAGIPEQNGYIIRPLLDITREELLQWLDRHNIAYAEDSTNLESGFARNLIRNELTPQMDRLLPGWKQNIQRMKNYGLEYEHLAKTVLDEVTTQKNRLDKKGFLNLPDTVRRAVFNAWLHQNEVQENVGRTQFERLGELEKLQAGKYIQLTDNLIISVDRYEFILESTPEKCAYWSELLTENRLEEGWQNEGYTYQFSKRRPYRDHNLQVNRKRIQFPLTLRTWRPGDKIRPLGMHGNKKIADLLSDAGVPLSEKSKCRVLQEFDHTLCAVIFPPSHRQAGMIAEHVRCDDQTETVLLITKSE